MAQRLTALLRNHADASHSILGHMKAVGDHGAMADHSGQIAPALDAHAGATDSLSQLLRAVQQNPSALSSPAPGGAGQPGRLGGGGNAATIGQLLAQHSSDAATAKNALDTHGIPQLTSSTTAPRDPYSQIGQTPGMLSQLTGMASGNDTPDHGHAVLNALQTAADHSHGIASLLENPVAGTTMAPQRAQSVADAIGDHGATLSSLARMVAKSPPGISPVPPSGGIPGSLTAALKAKALGGAATADSTSGAAVPVTGALADQMGRSLTSPNAAGAGPATIGGEVGKPVPISNTAGFPLAGMLGTLGASSAAPEPPVTPIPLAPGPSSSPASPLMPSSSTPSLPGPSIPLAPSALMAPLSGPIDNAPTPQAPRAPTPIAIPAPMDYDGVHSSFLSNASNTAGSIKNAGGSVTPSRAAGTDNDNSTSV